MRHAFLNNISKINCFILALIKKHSVMIHTVYLFSTGIVCRCLK